MRRGLGFSILVFVLSGCGSNDKSGDTPSANASVVADLGYNAPPTSTPPTQDVPPQSPSGRIDTEKNDLFEFRYAYPSAAGAIRPLKALLDKRLETAKADLVSTANDDRNEAKKDGYPYHLHSLDAKWNVVADLPGFLSLSAEVYQFTGGAHGMTAFDTLLWDRQANVSRAPVDVFASKEALRKAIQTPFCDLLDRQREQKRREPVLRGSGQMFTECIDPLSSTLILGSSNRKTFDRIGVLVAAYDAGPYAEGSYDVTVPVTAKVLAAVRPEYRASFAAAP